MFACKACLHRCLQVIAGEPAIFKISPIPASSRIFQRRSSTQAPPASNRTSPKHSGNPFTSSDRQSIKTTFRGPQRKPTLKRSGHSYTSSDRQPTKAIIPDSQKTPTLREKWLESRGPRPSTRKPSEKDDEILSHLHYLKDPLELAEFIRRTLRKNDFETATAVIRAASKSQQCIVSWNHLVDWQLHNGQMNAAIKTYNEMKKRAQTPDAHTYTIIFRGCAETKHPIQALANVLSIYNSMRSDKSTIKPSVIHTNAVLKMCARAGNMDALFAIASEMDEGGPACPDNLTFTTIINALRIDAVDELGSPLTVIQKRHYREKAVLRARQIWEDVTKRWLKGNVVIDEELACAMGRIMLIGNRRDLDDILSLVEQTMNIPRQIPRLGSEARKAMDPSSQQQKQECLTDRSGETEDPPLESPPSENFDVATVPLFEPPGEISKLGTKNSSLYAKPGQNSLSLVMQSLLESRVLAPASKYWNVFTNEIGVKPDSENYNAYLRILRVARASTETVQVLLDMPPTLMAAKTFRIAMSTCVRDKNNPHAFGNSGKILDIMQTSLAKPDIPVLQSYLELAITAPVNSNKTSSHGKSDYSKRAHGAQILRAINRLNPSIVNLRATIAFGDAAITGKTRASLERSDLIQEVLSLIQRMISAYDIILHKRMVPKEMYEQLEKERTKAAVFVSRQKEQLDRRNPRHHKQQKPQASGLQLDTELVEEPGLLDY